jgi:hypothetical protein
VSGFYAERTPEAVYFNVGKIGEDMAQASRRAMPPAELRRLLASNL